MGKELAKGEITMACVNRRSIGLGVGFSLSFLELILFNILIRDHGTTIRNVLIKFAEKRKLSVERKIKVSQRRNWKISRNGIIRG